MVERRGLSHLIQVDSAGTLDYHVGSRPDHRSIRALTSRGYSTSHRARQVGPDDSHQFDHLIVMDDTNMRDLKKRIGSQPGPAKLSRLLDWCPEAGRNDVPDPYYGDQRDFELMMDLIEVGCTALLDRLTQDSETTLG